MVNLALVVPAATPAAAHHVPAPENPAVASGTVEGTELLEDQVLNGCFNVTEQIFGWQGQGTYAGKSPDGQDVVYKAELAEGQALHQGPLKFTVDTHGPYYHGILGTHGMTDSACSQATAGSPITGAAFTVFAEGHVFKLDGGGTQVPCTGTGSWARLGADWHGQWALDADCTVVGNAAGTPGTGIAKAQTVHTHAGTHDGCGGSCVDNFKLNYTQHPPVDGLAVSVAGPTSRAITRTATLTAVVAYDGAPLQGASVAFSVAGPAAASPSSATVTTGATGQAAFTFNGPIEGNYVVTVTATSSAHPGEERSTTYTVFFSGPRPVMTLDSMPRVQNGDPATIVATVLDESDPVANLTPKDPVAGVGVSFSVAAPPSGQATPALGTATTAGGTGKANFPFTASRAGDYTVTATATYAGVQMSGTHTVHFDVKTMSLVGRINTVSSESNLRSAVMDPAGQYAYFTARNNRIIKFDLATFQRVGHLDVDFGSGIIAGEIAAAVIDPNGAFAYFGTGGAKIGSTIHPSRIVKVNLATFQQVGVISAAADEERIETAVIDPAGQFAYFGTTQVPGRVIKIDLQAFQRVGAVTTIGGYFESAVIDPAGQYAYFGKGSFPAGKIVKIDLSTFQEVGSATFGEGEEVPQSAVIGPAGDYAYFGTLGSNTRIVKVDLRTFQRVGALALPAVGFSDFGVNPISAAVIDPAGNFAYFGGSAGGTPVVVKVDLRTFEVMHVVPLITAAAAVAPLSAVIDPAGESAYFGSRSGQSPNVVGHVFKLDLTRTPRAALVAGNESYATPYVTPLTVGAPGVLANDVDTEDADPLVTFLPSDPPGGRVDMSPDGSFTYTPDVGFAGTDTFTYQASDGIDVSPPATVSVVVGAPPAGVESVSGGACAYYTHISLFGGAPERRGCGQTVPNDASASPSLSLPPSGSAGPLSAAKPEGAIAMYGPAALFSGIWPNDNAGPPPSGPLSVTSQASTGPGGSVTSSAQVTLHDTPLPVRCDGDPSGTTNCTAPGGIGPGPLIADETSSTCSAGESGISASATFVNGIVETKYDADTQLPIESEEIPLNPPANFTVEGTLDHVGDSYRVVLNEQIVDGNSITVNAAHMYLLGPTAVGDMIVGQSRCGAELAPPTVSVTASPATVTAGDAVTATWSAIETPGPTDWVGLYPAGDTPDPGLIAWAYTHGSAAGSLSLPIPAGAAPGATYELRLFRNNSYERLATSAPFSVVASSVAVTASPSAINPGAPVTATFSGIAAPTATDWVGLYDSASAPEPALLGWAYTNGIAAGSVSLFVPSNAPLGSTYELRLFTSNSYTRIATSAPFSVAASTATIVPSPSTANPGAPLTATWTGIAAPSATDWVGLYDSASTLNPGLLAWAYTNGAADGSVNLFVPAGAPLGDNYELRLFTNNTYTRLATSAPFSVAVSNATISATPSSVANGSPVTATWSGIGAPTATDWVGLYASSGAADPAIVAWAYAGGAAAGNLNLIVPAGSLPAATYELRLFSNNSYTRLATSNSFTVS